MYICLCLFIQCPNKTLNLQYIFFIVIFSDRKKEKFNVFFSYEWKTLENALDKRIYFTKLHRKFLKNILFTWRKTLLKEKYLKDGGIFFFYKIWVDISAVEHEKFI